MREECVTIVEKLKKLGADNAIATGYNYSQRQIKFANSKTVRKSVEQRSEIHLFVSVGKKIAETRIDADIDQPNINAVLEKFVSLAKKLPDNSDFEEVASGKFTYPVINSFDKKIPTADEQSVDLVSQVLDSCNGVKAGGMFETNESEVYLVSSNGPQATHKSTSVYFSIRCLAEQNASGHKVSAGAFLSDVNYTELAHQAKELAFKAKNPIKGQQGTYNVVFDAFPYAALLDPFTNSTSVFSVESGLSALGGKIGKQIASESVTIYDDPTLANAFHSTPFDEEGRPTKRTSIVQNGELKTYLHNSSTAKHQNVAPTGHAGITAPHPFNPVVESGKSTIDELIQETKNGIYITNIWYTRFQNYSTSDFSTIPRDAILLIENGELTKPIREIRLSDNLLGILQRTKLLSSNQRQIYGWEVETPIFSCDALVENVKITTPQS